MPERKAYGNRGSLMELGKPRLAQTPLAAPIDEAERLILSREIALSPAAPAAESEREAQLASQVPNTPPQVSRVPGADEIPSRLRNSEPKGRPASEDVLARLRKTRQPIAVVGFKLPAKLKEELAAVAQHNSTDMTRIVVEALERFLSELPHPPGWKN